MKMYVRVATMLEANGVDTYSLLLDQQRLTIVLPVVFMTAPADISRPVSIVAVLASKYSKPVMMYSEL